MKHFLWCILYVWIYQPVFGQDAVYFHQNPRPAYGTVITINPTSIQFAPLLDSSSIQTISTDSIEQIRFSDSTVFSIHKDVDLHPNKRLWGFNTSITAPLYGHFNIGYEHYFQKGQSFRLTVGVIAAENEISNYYDEKGMYVWLGYKIMLSEKKKTYQNEKQLLHGFYLQPGLLLGGLNSQTDGQATGEFKGGQWFTYYTVPPSNTTNRFSGLFLTPGYHFVSSQGFTLDLNVSIGYVHENEVTRKYWYAYWCPDPHIPFGISSSIKIGYLFLTEKRFQLAD